MTRVLPFVAGPHHITPWHTASAHFSQYHLFWTRTNNIRQASNVKLLLLQPNRTITATVRALQIYVSLPFSIYVVVLIILWYVVKIALSAATRIARLSYTTEKTSVKSTKGVHLKQLLVLEVLWSFSSNHSWSMMKKMMGRQCLSVKRGVRILGNTVMRIPADAGTGCPGFRLVYRTYLTVA